MFRNVYLKVGVLFGLLGALLVLTYFFTLYWLGNNPLPDMNRLDILIILLCVLFTLGYFRDRRNKGVLHFWEGAILALPVVLISTLLSTLVIYLFMLWEPEVFTTYIHEMQKLIQADYQAGRFKDTNDYRSFLEGLPGITPLSKAFDIFIKSFFICFCTTGILIIIMRKHPR